MGTKGRALSLVLEKKAPRLSQEAFPAGLPTHPPGRSDPGQFLENIQWPDLGSTRRPLRVTDHGLSLGKWAGRWGAAEAESTRWRLHIASRTPDCGDGDLAAHSPAI